MKVLRADQVYPRGEKLAIYARIHRYVVHAQATVRRVPARRADLLSQHRWCPHEEQERLVRVVVQSDRRSMTRPISPRPA